MKSTVRRVESGIIPTTSNDGSIEKDGVFLPEVGRRDDGLWVGSRKCLGADPRIQLRWAVDRKYWGKGFRLMGFRSNSGFSPDPRPKQLSAHGQMILEEMADGSLEERLPEGTQFYTFVLYRKLWFGTLEQMNIVRFSETIPSAKTVIGRIEDQLRLQHLSEDYDLSGIKSQVARNEAIIALHRSNQKLADVTSPKPDDSVEAQVRRDVEATVKKLKKAMTRVELVVALQDVMKQLKRNPAWKKLKKEQQDKLIQEIVGDLDAQEEFFQP